MDWFPWYPALFEADTLHLTPAQDGLYRRLIDWYMVHRRPLPDDDRALAAICRVSLEDWQNASSILRAYFKHKRGMLHLGRCDALLADQDAKSRVRSEVAKKGATKRWGNKRQEKGKREDASSIASAMLIDARGQDKTRDKEEKSVARKRAPLVDLLEYIFTEADRTLVANYKLDPDRVFAKIKNWAANATPAKRRKRDVQAFLRNWCADTKPDGASPDLTPAKPVVVPDCWQNGLAPVAEKAGANLRSLLYSTVPKVMDCNRLVLTAKTRFVADELRGKYGPDLSKLWAGPIEVKEAAA